MKGQSIKGGVKRGSKSRPDTRQRTRSVAQLGRMFDDLYTQLDLQLTRLAQIQLQFDALRLKIRLL